MTTLIKGDSLERCQCAVFREGWVQWGRQVYQLH